MCYFREMERLPEEQLLSHFMKGEHVMHHSVVYGMVYVWIWWLYGHVPGGIICITLKPETVKVWALSLHACSSLESDLDDMTDEDTQSKVVTAHKEEAKAMNAKDKRDRDRIRQKLGTYIDPLDSAVVGLKLITSCCMHTSLFSSTWVPITIHYSLIRLI